MKRPKSYIVAVGFAIMLIAAIRSFGSDMLVPTTTGIAMCNSVVTSGVDVDMGSCTGGVILPTGTTAQRPTGSIGIIRKNSTLSTLETYNGTSWVNMIPPIQAYEVTTQRLNAFPIFSSATVSSGTAVYQLTVDGTSNGAAIFPNGIIAESINPIVNDNSAAYQMSWILSNSNKTLTITANKLTTASLLTGILGQAPANGAVVNVQVWGY